jgi:hypothetical protein
MLTIHSFALKKMLLNIFLTTFTMAGKPDAATLPDSSANPNPAKQATHEVLPKKESHKALPRRTSPLRNLLRP